jgi:hypothetical protein
LASKKLKKHPALMQKRFGHAISTRELPFSLPAAIDPLQTLMIEVNQAAQDSLGDRLKPHHNSYQGPTLPLRSWKHGSLTKMLNWNNRPFDGARLVG